MIVILVVWICHDLCKGATVQRQRLCPERFVFLFLLRSCQSEKCVCPSTQTLLLPVLGLVVCFCGNFLIRYISNRNYASFMIVNYYCHLRFHQTLEIRDSSSRLDFETRSRRDKLFFETRQRITRRIFLRSRNVFEIFRCQKM